MPFNHNKSSVRLPDGLNKNELKRHVQLCTGLSERERTLLVHILDQADAWIHSVQDIRARMQWGEVRWRTVRNALQLKKILVQQKIRIDDKSHIWTLNFDFSVVLALCSISELSTGGTKTEGSRARVIHDKAKSMDHVSLCKTEGSREPIQNRGIDIPRLPKEPPQPVVVSLLIKEMGLTAAESERVAWAARGAAHDQIENLADAWRTAKQRPTQPGAGLAVHLAKLAAAGQLEPTKEKSYATDQVSQSESPRAICERIGATLAGYILSGPSVTHPLTVLPYGHLQGADGRVLDDRTAAARWRSVEVGEADCKRIPVA